MCAWLGDQIGAALGAEPSLTGARDPIAVFRLDSIVEGTVPKLDVRWTDALAVADRIYIRTQSDDGYARAQVIMNLDDVVAIAAPPRPPSPARVSRRQHPVEVTAGPYRVGGIAHLPPGADPERYMSSYPRKWLPLTDCTVATEGDEWAVEVVIVNTDHATRDKTAYRPPPFG
jgi:hypothetical protein